MRGGFRRSLLALFLCAAAAAVAVAVPGDLDLRFATDGRRVIDSGGNFDAARDVAIRPDGAW